MSADTPSVIIHDDDQLYRRLHHSQVYEDGTVKRIAYMLKGKPDGEAWDSRLSTVRWQAIPLIVRSKATTPESYV